MRNLVYVINGMRLIKTTSITTNRYYSQTEVVVGVARDGPGREGGDCSTGDAAVAVAVAGSSRG